MQICPSTYKISVENKNKKANIQTLNAAFLDVSWTSAI